MANIKKYKVGEIKGILEAIYNDPKQRRKTVPLFMSEPGLGKTQVIEEFMREKKVYKPPFILSQRMPFEISGMALVDRERDIMKYYDFDFILDLKDGDILFIDETFNANPLTLSAFLTFLESRITISGRKLPDIMIVAAANPKGMPVLSPQIRRRFLQYDIIFDDVSWIQYMYNQYNMPKLISQKLCNLIRNETEFTGYNYDTPADLDDAVDMIIKNIPTPYDSKIKPILDTLIANPLKQDITLKNGTILGANEQFKWLDMIRIDKDITIFDDKSKVTTTKNEILMLDANDNVIGEISNIDILKNVYCYSDSAIADCLNGQILTFQINPGVSSTTLFFKYNKT